MFAASVISLISTRKKIIVAIVMVGLSLSLSLSPILPTATLNSNVLGQTQFRIFMFCQNISPIGTIDCRGSIVDPAGHGVPQGGTLVYTIGEEIIYQCANKQGKIVRENQGPIQLTTQISGSEILPNPELGFSFIIPASAQPTLDCKGQTHTAQIISIELTTQTTQYIV